MKVGCGIHPRCFYEFGLPDQIPCFLQQGHMFYYKKNSLFDRKRIGQGKGGVFSDRNGAAKGWKIMLKSGRRGLV
jgi:hypothetical protein